MGRFEYAAARDTFAALVEAQPEDANLMVNLAIATLNRQQEGDEAAALAMVEEVIARDPGQLRAQYVAGLLRLYLSSPAEAMAHFQVVTGADPRDAYAAYYLGQCLAQQGDQAQALDWYRKALALDPYLRSAYYGAFQAEQRLGHRDQARSPMETYQRLANNPQARLAEFKYSRMGPKAEAMVLGAPSPAPAAVAPGPVLAAPQPLPVEGGEALTWPAPGTRPAGVAVADLDGDGILDLLVPRAGPAAGTLVLLGRHGGEFRVDSGHPLSAIADVNAALVGDSDNDGLTDIYLARRGPNQLWRQARPGVWEDVTAATMTAAGDADTVDGAFLDADHDGDLDLFLVNADTPNELLNNNLDGTFRPLAAERGIAGPPGGGGRQVLPVDMDSDRDTDLIVIGATPPHQAWLNDRLWSYRPAEGLDAFLAAPIAAALAADLDADGAVELYSLGPEGSLKRWSRNGSGAFRAEELAAIEPAGGAAWAQLALADLDGDGTLDLVASGPWGWNVFAADGRQLAADSRRADGALTWAAPVLLDPAAGPSLVALTGRGLLLWPPGPGRGAFVSLSLTGMADASRAMRSNASGVGTGVALRAGPHWGIASTLRPRSGPGQDLQPLSLGIGTAGQADFAAIDWSDGVFQSELALAPGEVHRIVETQRQLSSCPVLFAWDGSGYAFVTDLLGVGGLGYAVGPGEYAQPRPWEHLLLPEGLLKPRDGRYQVKLTEPMEEAAYLDSARLVAWDLPPGWRWSWTNAWASRGRRPRGAARFYRSEVLPSQVLDQGGKDVTSALARADGEAVDPGPLDRRFIGRLAGEQVLTLTFDPQGSGSPGRGGAGPGRPTGKWKSRQEAGAGPGRRSPRRTARRASPDRRRLDRVPLLPNQLRGLAGRCQLRCSQPGGAWRGRRLAARPDPVRLPRGHAQAHGGPPAGSTAWDRRPAPARQSGDLLGPHLGCLRGDPPGGPAPRPTASRRPPRPDRLPEAPDLPPGQTGVRLRNPHALLGHPHHGGFLHPPGARGRPGRRNRRRPGYHRSGGGDPPRVRGPRRAAPGLDPPPGPGEPRLDQGHGHLHQGRRECGPLA